MTLSFPDAPIIDARTAENIARELADRASAYAPGWHIGERGTGAASAAIFGRFTQALIERINSSPDKHQLAFLDLMGIDLLPAHAARAPVVLTPLPSAGDGQVPARTRVGAKVPGRQDPVIFETERPVGLAAARLADVVTVWPGRDAVADHSAALAGGQPVTLWSPLSPVAHELYLSHDVHFALAGDSTVAIDFTLARAGSAPFETIWEYWDGELWRGFRLFESDPADLSKSFDGTQGFTRSGTIRLTGDCCDSVPTVVNGISAHWIRARLASALPRQLGRVFPSIDRITVRTIIDRTIPAGADGLAPDAAHANGTKLDLSSTFFPLGQAGPGSVLTLTSAEAFSKPGAELTVAMIRSKTPAERSDDLTAAYQLDVNAAKTLMDSVIALLQNTIIPGLTVLRDGALTHPLGPWPWGVTDWPTVFQFWKNELQTAKNNAAGSGGGLGGLFGLAQAAFDAAVNTILGTLGTVSTYFTTDGTLIGFAQTSITNALNEVTQALANLQTILNGLLTFTPETAAVGLGAKQPKLMPPQVAWEFWDGTRWRVLALRDISDPDAPVFQPNPGVVATFTFMVPADWEPLSLNGLVGRFLRARLLSGGYGTLRTTSWKDQNTGLIHFMPITENRPPALDALALGYRYESPRVPPEHCVVHGDFAWQDQSLEARTPGEPFPPFLPVADTAPTLYLGFDGPLPADELGIWFDIEQHDAQAAGPTLRWEYADGESWLPLPVTDETIGLSQPGIVHVVYPGLPPIPVAQVLRGERSMLTVRNERNSPRFNPGDRLWIENEGKGELATVRDRRDDILELVTPLAKTYDRGTVARARPARFGTPRTWIRARLADPGDPPMSRVRSVQSNAVWASQRQTSANELLGSSNGQQNQAFFFRNTPVLPNELIEVRELEGARAHVEYEILRRELLAAGVPDRDIRPEPDPATQRINAVWVRWHPQRSLLFSGPDQRHYTLERSRGRVMFGDGRQGRIPPAGTDNIRAVRYTAGGGPEGNVPAGAISQLLSGVPAQKVSNPRAADGGCEGESAALVRRRGPRTIRHRRQAISRDDYEALAREASPAVALVRAQPTTDRSGRRAAGAVTLFVVPQSGDREPTPSLSLLREVQAFLAARVPVGARDGIIVEPPRYFPVGVEAAIAARLGFEAGALREVVLSALAAYLHPLTGGPGGAGWPFGRDVYLSDVAARLESIEGVDFVQTLRLTSTGMAQGESVAVPSDHLVSAGDLRVTLTAAGD